MTSVIWVFRIRNGATDRLRPGYILSMCATIRSVLFARTRMPDCPLCAALAEAYAEDRRRAYFHCPCCDLVFADPASHLDAAAARAEYDRHENDPADERYRRFLNRLAAPLLERLSAGMHGLDFGCGPGPALPVMLEEAGMRMAVYDPIYRPDRQALDRQYDFVTCTETVEHFVDPRREWALLASLTRPGGWLGIMTKLVISRERFLRWHYKEDPTHVAFYSPATFDWIGARFGMAVERVDRDALLLRKAFDD